jgi:signal transduction histidine kinase
MYDRLLEARVPEIRAHLNADFSFQEKSVRFIENHDEPRVIPKFGREKSYAAASIMATIPGMRFFFEGQAEGRRVHLPVQLGREPHELRDPEAEAFYKMLLAYSKQEALHEGLWQKHEVHRAEDKDPSEESLLCWSWRHGQGLRLIVVNYSPAPARGRIPLPQEWFQTERVHLLDRWSGLVYERECAELVRDGLYVNLGRWKAHLFEIK